MRKKMRKLPLFPTEATKKELEAYRAVNCSQLLLKIVDCSV